MDSNRPLFILLKQLLNYLIIYVGGSKSLLFLFLTSFVKTDLKSAASGGSEKC